MFKCLPIHAACQFDKATRTINAIENDNLQRVFSDYVCCVWTKNKITKTQTGRKDFFNLKKAQEQTAEAERQKSKIKTDLKHNEAYFTTTIKVYTVWESRMTKLIGDWMLAVKCNQAANQQNTKITQFIQLCKCKPVECASLQKKLHAF